MARITTDSNDPGLTRGGNEEITPQADVYLIGPSGRPLVRPVREHYMHSICGTITEMAFEIAVTYAQDPKFYGFTYCVKCQKHRPVSEFTWVGTTEQVGS